MAGAKVLDNQDPTTKEYLAKIGEIVVLLNHLESIMEFYIWELIAAQGTAYGRKEIGKRVTTPLEFMQKVDLLRSLILERLGEEKAKKYLELHKQIVACCEFRNDVSHSVWYIQYGNKEEGIPSITHKINVQKVLKANKSFDPTKAFSNVNLTDLESQAETINIVISKLTFFMTTDD